MPRNYGDFARPTYRDARWLETHWFSAVTTDHIRLHFWMGFRTNLDVAATKIYVYSNVGTSVLEMDFADQQYHSPIGSSARLSDFALDSGIAVRSKKAPNDYELTYRSKDGRLGASLHLAALTPPLDLAFTEVPGATPGFVAYHRKQDDTTPAGRTGTEPIGHIDQTMVVTGEIVLDGVPHPVDCTANRDHSWSPRAEVLGGIGGYDEFHFGTDLNFNAHTSLASATDGSYNVTHGYLAKGDEPRRLKSVAVQYEKQGYRTERVRYDIVDETGETYAITGTSRASAQMDMGQNTWLVMDLLDIECNGLTGYAELQWHDNIPRMQGARLRAGE